MRDITQLENHMSELIHLTLVGLLSAAKGLALVQKSAKVLSTFEKKFEDISILVVGHFFFY